MAFPFVFPGAYSRPQVLNNCDAYGWIHSPEPEVDVGRQLVSSDEPTANAACVYLQNLNHNPLDVGDNLPDPSSGP